MRLHLLIQRHGLPATRIVWPISPSSLSGQRASSHSVPNGGYTIAQLLEDVNDVVPLETETGLFENESGGQWGLEDYVVEIAGSECLHFMEVDGLLRDEDEVVIRALQLADLRARRISGRHQISADGRHLIDGVPFGRPFVKRSVSSRPGITIPPRKKRRTIHSGWASGMADDDEDVEWAPSLHDSEKQLALMPDCQDVDEDTVIHQDSDDAPVSESDADESDVDEDLTQELEDLKDDLGHDSTGLADSQEPEAYSLRGRKRKPPSLPRSAHPVSHPSSEKPPADMPPKPAKSVRFQKQTEVDLPTPSKGKELSSDESVSSKSDSSSIDTTSDEDEDSSDSEDEESPSDSEETSSDSDGDTSSDSDDTSSSDESVDACTPKRHQEAKVSAPGQGSAQTKKSNRRNKLRCRLKKLKELGVLDKDANFEALRRYDETHPGPYPVSSEKSHAKEKEQAEFMAKRQKLLEDLESGGVDIDGTSEKENVPPGRNSTTDLCTQGEVSNTVAEVDTQPSGESAPETSKRRSLDVAASRRLLFGSLGVRTPRSKEDEAATRKKLAGKVHQFQPQRKAEENVTEEPESDSEVNWQEKLTLKATECLYDGITMKDPTFPFEQRWDSDAWNAIRERKGWGKKRKRGRQSYGYDGEWTEQDENFNDYYTNGETDINYDENIADTTDELENGGHPMPEGTTEEDLPLPEDLSSAPDIAESDIKNGVIIAFKLLEVSKATNWEPKSSDYRVAEVHGDPEDGQFTVRLAKRDRRQKENVEDEEGNREYSGFEMPGFEDDDEDDGFRTLSFAELIEPKLLRTVDTADLEDATEANNAPVTEQSIPSAVAQRHVTDTPSLSDDIRSSPSSFPVLPSSPPAEALFHGKEDRARDIRPILVKGKKEWKLLPSADTASLGTWSVRRGDTVAVCLDSGKKGFAKVSDLRIVDGGRYIIVYTWLYTREEVVAELHEGGALSERYREHLNRKWPVGAPYKYMLSTNRTVTLWDTALTRAPEVVSQMSTNWIYSTTQRKRKICNVDEPRFRWMKRILDLEPADLPDQSVETEKPADGDDKQVEERSPSPVVRSPSFTGFQSLGSSSPRSETGNNTAAPPLPAASQGNEGSANFASKQNHTASQASRNQEIISSPKSYSSFDRILDEFIQGSRQDRSDCQDRSSAPSEDEEQDSSEMLNDVNQPAESKENRQQAEERSTSPSESDESDPFSDIGKTPKKKGRKESEEMQGSNNEGDMVDVFSTQKSPTSYQPNGSGKPSQADSVAESVLDVKTEPSQPKSSQVADIVDLTQDTPESDRGDEGESQQLPRGPGWVQKNEPASRRTRASTGGRVQMLKEVSISPPKVKRGKRRSE
ncbi:hypothetical protein PHISCL_01809 [Aspergillus sclerotialis]|uniref:DUF7357 domain-containing protein n=1 Tax=Aspergillus sclerotialis TaxID=2070753 RepID=A0A3A2ZU31_9EURO|nr:hypothetical protein PHISCL_01809 [Aspergillus sclerotialis]